MNETGDAIITAPWGTTYAPNELLGGNEYPHFIGYNDQGDFKIRLDVI